MKKLFYVLSLALLASCNNVVDLQQVENENAGGRLPQVTVINQLGEVTPLLASAVAQSQYVATSRGEAMPEIESIEMIKDSKGNPAIYVVNNANNQGFTLISATMDYNPIIATSDEGHFSWEAAQQCGASIVVGESIQAIEHVAELPDSIRLRFNAAWEQYNTSKEELKLPQSRSTNDVYSFISSKISEWQSQGYTVYSLSNYMNTSTYASLPSDVQYNLDNMAHGYANPNYGGIYNVSFVLEKRPFVGSYVPALMTTEWHQKKPYSNCLVPDTLLVGCVPIAIGQIMKYHGYPVFANVPYFLAEIRNLCGHPNNDANRDVDLETALSVFNQKGYNNVIDINHNISRVISEIEARRPVFMCGYTNIFKTHGHAWVADGVSYGQTMLELKLMCLENCPSGYTPSYFENPYNYDLLLSNSPVRLHMNWGQEPDAGQNGTNLNGFYYDSDISYIDCNNQTNNYSHYRKDLINIYH